MTGSCVIKIQTERTSVSSIQADEREVRDSKPIRERNETKRKRSKI